MLTDVAELIRLASIESNNGNYIKAIPYYNDAINILSQKPNLKSTLALLYRLMSACYRKLRENYLAEIYIKLSLDADPKYGQAYFDLGFLQCLKNEHIEAIINFEKAIEYKCKDPSLPEIYYLLSGAYFKKSIQMHDGNDSEIQAKKVILQKAFTVIKKALEFESNNVAYCLLAGKICLWLDRHFDPDDFSNTKIYLTVAANLGSQEAKKLLNDLLIDPVVKHNFEAVSFFYKGSLKAEMHDYKGAIADFEKALECGYEKPMELYVNIASSHNAIAQSILERNGNSFADTVGVSRDDVISESQRAYATITRVLECEIRDDEILKQCYLIAGMSSFRIAAYSKMSKDLLNAINYLGKAGDLGSQEANSVLKAIQ